MNSEIGGYSRNTHFHRLLNSEIWTTSQWDLFCLRFRSLRKFKHCFLWLYQPWGLKSSMGEVFTCPFQRPWNCTHIWFVLTKQGSTASSFSVAQQWLMLFMHVNFCDKWRNLGRCCSLCCPLTLTVILTITNAQSALPQDRAAQLLWFCWLERWWQKS